jgi:hypothetical protein
VCALTLASGSSGFGELERLKNSINKADSGSRFGIYILNGGLTSNSILDLKLRR